MVSMNGFLILLFTILVGLVSCYSIHDLISSPYSFASDLHKLCHKNNTNQETFKEALEDARKCYNNFTQSTESLCHTLENNIETCSQSTVDYLTDCLPKESKDLPASLAQTAVAIIDTFCDSTGDVLIEITNGCIHSYTYRENQTEECKEAAKELHKAVFSKFSKSEACLAGRKAANCWKDYVNKNCKNSNSKELFTRFYNAALFTCK